MPPHCSAIHLSFTLTAPYPSHTAHIGHTGIQILHILHPTVAAVQYSLTAPYCYHTAYIAHTTQCIHYTHCTPHILHTYCTCCQKHCSAVPFNSTLLLSHCTYCTHYTHIAHLLHMLSKKTLQFTSVPFNSPPLRHHNAMHCCTYCIIAHCIVPTHCIFADCIIHCK